MNKWRIYIVSFMLLTLLVIFMPGCDTETNTPDNSNNEITEEYTLTIEVNPSGGGTTSPAAGTHEYSYGTEVDITAIPAFGYEFDHWSGNEEGTNEIISMNITSDTNINANFSPKLHWLYDWNEAQSRAQTENKIIMINFYTDSCPACRKLDSNTYSDVELSTFLNDNFVCLKSNNTKNNLYQNYSNMQYVPTIIFASPEGTEIYRMIGYRSANSFYQSSQEVLSQWEP